MKEYFLSLLLTSIFGGVFTMLAGGKMEKYMKYIVSLVCLCLMILPLRGIFKLDFSSAVSEIDGISYPVYEYDLDSLAVAEAENRFGEYINTIVFDKFGIMPQSTNIEIDWEPNEPVIRSITVVLDDGAYIGDVEAFLGGELGGEVYVIEG